MQKDIKETIKSLLQRTLLPAVYALNKKKNKKSNLVVFSDCHHESCPYSMRYLFDMARRDPSLEVVGDFNDYSKGSFYALRCSISFMKLYARAGAVVICDNHLPVASAKKKKDSFVVQLWHAGGALKRFGYDNENNIPSSYRGGNVFGNYDLVTVSAEYAIPAFESAMRLSPGIVKATGISRTDHMFDEKYIASVRAHFYREDPSREGKKIILYAPTFRGNSGEARTVGYEDILEVQEELPEDWLMIKKAHPHDRSHRSQKDSALSSEELLIVCDLLITDYSSIIYDYSLLGKPLLLYVPDMEDYRRENGFYEDYDSIPATKVFTKERLKDSIVDAVLRFDEDRKREMTEFAKRTMTCCDGSVSGRLLDEIKKRVV